MLRSEMNASNDSRLIERMGELLPPDGWLLTDEASLNAAGDDFGHIVHRPPLAVLHAGSVEDVIEVVSFARRHGLKVAARGSGHTPFGQSQVGDGIQIDMSSLNAVRAVHGDRIEVEAGATWGAVIEAAGARGLRPPVDIYTHLTVGGTLSVGGIGGSSFRFGTQIDNVAELQVVTGTGDLVTCSEEVERDLFEAVLAGQGQCGIIVRATIDLIPARHSARVYNLIYPDLPSLTRDHARLMDDGRFDDLLGWILPTPEGGFTFKLQATSFFTEPERPDDERLLDGLGFAPGAEEIADETYREFTERTTLYVQGMQAAGALGLPHAWLTLGVEQQRADAFIGETLRELTPGDVDQAGTIMLLFGFRTSVLRRPLFRPPAAAGTYFVFGLLSTAAGPEEAERQVGRNRRLFERNREQGGSLYAIAALPLSSEDWRRHFGPAWERFAHARRRFDPDGVLTPGPGIFEAP